MDAKSCIEDASRLVLSSVRHHAYVIYPLSTFLGYTGSLHAPSLSSSEMVYD